MQKQLGAIGLVAGTCIGSGMMALPMVLAKLGIIPSLALMLFVWWVMYYTSLVNLEINLQAGQGLSLGALGRRFSGRGAELIGAISLKLLSYALLAVFIYGGSSVAQELLVSKMEVRYSFDVIATCYAVVAMAVLLLPIRMIDYFNRLLFVSLLVVIVILIFGLMMAVDWSHLPLFSDRYHEISVWAALLPVVFTSFGFQVIFHTLTNYCHSNPAMLKRAFLWGSLIPAFIYILWTSSVLSVVYHDDPYFYEQMVVGKVEVGKLVEVLSGISPWQSVQLLVWWISMLAIATSVLGVGMGLCDAIKMMLAKIIPSPTVRHILAPVLTVLPAYFTVMCIPNAFIAILGFAGMILAVIAVLLPIYLLLQIKKANYFYPILEKKWMIALCFLVGVIVIFSEFYNMSR